MNWNEWLEPEEVKKDEPLKNHTTFQIGGKADWYIIPKSAKHLCETIKRCKKEKVPYYILGRGSNVLFGDKGFRGAVIEVGKGLENVEFSEDGLVTAEAGISLAKLANMLARRGYTGFEFASGIPGTVGGAVVMNAGAYGGEIKDCIVNAICMDEDGLEVEYKAGELELGYRTSRIQKEHLILLRATFSFSKGETEQIREVMKELNQRRKEKQPLEYASAGSTFKRPEGYFAGKLIEEAGLRGYSVGDAQISTKHCGFLINKGNATAADVRKCIEDVRKRVKEHSGVELEPEVRFVGEFV